MLKQYDETRIEEYGKVIIDVAEDAEISIVGNCIWGIILENNLKQRHI